MRSEVITTPKNEINLSEQPEEKKDRPSLLLHSCCGPCSTAVVERLIPDYDITVFFYNPNITDKDEYIKRQETQKSFIDQYNLNSKRTSLLHYKEGEYDPSRFYELVRGHEQDPEGGDRCGICFKLRMEKTAYEAMLLGFDYFSTTLSVSPHKNYEIISKIGYEFSAKCGMCFLASDFKKKDGYKRSVELSKKYNLYRQNFCGCEFSK